ncbi:hypothetical protein F5Y03DRAFT_46148 [Xylaria venustula]|nr:hypothetical protein F5Y03DRAFT_46148 [Xylaria venustula]
MTMVHSCLSTAPGHTHQPEAVSLVDETTSEPPDTVSSNSARLQQEQDLPATTVTPADNSGLTFADLPLEIREIIWRFALPEPRIFNALVWVSAGLKMQLLNRSELKMPLAHACFEARRIVKESGYVLAFRDEDESEDTGVWFNPRKDKIERTIWGPGDWNSII